MKLSRKMVFLVSALVVGVMLSAQAAFATRPCVDAGMSAASAIAQQNEHDCCDTMASITSLCVAKCTDSNKLSGHTDIPAAKAPAEAVLKVDFPRLVLPHPRLWLARSGLDPPKTVRFCTFLI